MTFVCHHVKEKISGQVNAAALPPAGCTQSIASHFDVK